MTVVSLPKISAALQPAFLPVQNSDHRVLIVGQKTSAGTAVSGDLQTNILNDNSWDTLAGPTSMGAAMCRAFRRENGVTRLDAIFLDDNGSGVDATGTVVFSGTATANGTLTVEIGSSRDHKLTVSVTSGDTATVIGDALVTAVTADTKIPVTAANVTGTVTMTAENAGTEGNSIGLRVTGTVAGVTHSVTAMTGGATNPTLTTVFDVISNDRYQSIIWPFTYTLTELKALLDPRFNPNKGVLDGVGITTSVDTLSNLTTAGNAENSESVCIWGNKTVSKTSYKGGQFFELPYVLSSYIAGVRSLRLTDGANIQNLVSVTGAGRDAFGGPALSSLPYFNTPLSFVDVANNSDGFNDVEQDQLNDAGISFIGNNVAGNTVILGSAVTTYKTDNAGNPDQTFKFLNYVDTGSNAREYIVNNTKKQYAQTRLTDGQLVPGRSITNARAIKQFIIGLYLDLAGADFVLTRAPASGDPNDPFKFFKDSIIISEDLSTGKVNVEFQMPIVTQAREFQFTINVKFNID